AWYDKDMNDSPTPKGPRPNFEDITLYDQDTGEPFIFTAKEQEFFWKQGFTHVPKRSPERRKALREKRYEGKDTFSIKCKKCQKIGLVTIEPADTHEILCGDCFDAAWNEYLEKNPAYKQEYEAA